MTEGDENIDRLFSLHDLLFLKVRSLHNSVISYYITVGFGVSDPEIHGMKDELKC